MLFGPRPLFSPDTGAWFNPADATVRDQRCGTNGSRKGRDFAFSGAVDALRINDKVYDFEPLGVVTRDAG